MNEEEYIQFLMDSGMLGMTPEQPAFGLFDPAKNKAYADPNKLVKSTQSYLNQQPNLLGFDPISEAGGPAFEAYTPQSDILLGELGDDDIGQRVRTDLQNGVGILDTKNRLAQLKKQYEDTDGAEGISPDTYEAYSDFLNRYSQAVAQDSVALNNQRLQATEGDPYGEVPVYEPDQRLADIEAAGSFGLYGGQGDTAQKFLAGEKGRQLSFGDNPMRVGASGLAEPGESNTPASDALRIYFANRGARKERRERNAPRTERARQAAIETIRRETERVRRPSQANERARANIIAYRLAMGLSPE